MKYLVALFILSFLACNTKNKKELYTGKSLCKIVNQISESDQRYRGLPILAPQIIADRENLPEKIKKKQDSLFSLQKEIDKTNTELIIDIIKTVGYPQKGNLPCEPNLISVAITHAPKEYWDELKPLIEHEYKLGRINEFAYKMAMWHFGGRNMEYLKKEFEYKTKDGKLQFKL